MSRAMRWLLGDLHADLLRLEERIRQVTKEIEAIADREDVTRRLMTIPGIGALGATALLAAVGDGLQFRKARDLEAWLGLVPRQYSTGGKQTLLGISKRGNRYVRKLLVHGARSCFRHLDRTRDRLGNWLNGLVTRMHPNKAVVALAAKMARIVWAVLSQPGALYERRDLLSLDAQSSIARLGTSDDETVDQHAVNPVQKSGLRARTIIGNGVRGSHHGLAATAVHSREAFTQLESSFATSRPLARTGRTIHFLTRRLFRIALSSIASAKQLLQLGVLILQSLQLPGIGDIHAAILRLVFVKGRFRYAMLAADIGRLLAALLLLQHPDDLLFREPCTLHSVRLLNATDSTKIWRKFRVSGQIPYPACKAPSCLGRALEPFPNCATARAHLTIHGICPELCLFIITSQRNKTDRVL